MINSNKISQSEKSELKDIINTIHKSISSKSHKNIKPKSHNQLRKTNKVRLLYGKDSSNSREHGNCNSPGTGGYHPCPPGYHCDGNTNSCVPSKLKPTIK